MNFHKTIGFLAALLLMIGLGAPDSFAQNRISVTLDIPADGVVEEAKTSVGVTVTLNPEPDDGTTVAVKVVAALLDGSQIGSTTITVVGGEDDSNNGTIDVTPPRDADADNETAQVTATAAGYASGLIAMVITDDELTINIEFSQETFREGEETDNVTITATLQNSDGVTQSDADATTVAVAFSPGKLLTPVLDGADADAAVTKITVAVTNGTGTRSQLKITPVDNDDNEETNVEVTATATAAGYVAGTTILTIEDDEQTLKLVVDPTKFTEGDATNSLAVTVTLEPASEDQTPVTVTATINGIPISGAMVDLTINANANDADGTLTVTLPDDEVNSGDRTIVLTAAFGDGADKVTSNSVDVTVVDDDQDQTLTLTLDPDELREGGDGAVDVTVTFAYRVAAETPVTVTATIDGIPVAAQQVITFLEAQTM